MRRSVRLFLATLFILFSYHPTLLASDYPVVIEDAVGRDVKITDTPTRIFSGGLNVDSTLLKLLPSSRIVAVTRFADDPSRSYVVDEASGISSYRQVRPGTVLKHSPDLILLTSYTRAGIRQKIQEFDIPVLVTHQVNTKKDIKKNTRLIGKAVGKSVSADNWLRTMDRKLRELSQRKDRSTILHYTYSGAVPGKSTLPNLIFTLAGLENVAASVGLEGWKVITPEQILKRPPKWFILEKTNQNQLIKKLKNDPALSSIESVKENRFRSVEPKYLTVASPFLHHAAAFWAESFQENS